MESPVGPTQILPLTGKWYAKLYVSLRDRDGEGDWLPMLPSMRVVPNEVVGFFCNGMVALTSQEGGRFDGWISVIGIHALAQPYCPPRGYRDQSGTIDQDGRITLKLDRRVLPDCEHVSGDASVLTGTFVTRPANCPECGDIVLESSREFMTCTWRWTSYGVPMEHTYNAERVDTLRMTYAVNQ